MQEDKKPLFEAADTLKACIEIYAAMLPTMKINKDMMYRAASSGFLNATDMADYLVTKGMPFREAHSCAGKAVAYALRHKKELHELSLEELQTFSSLISEDIFSFLTIEQMISRRKSFGGTAAENVMAAVKEAERHEN